MKPPLSLFFQIQKGSDEFLDVTTEMPHVTSEYPQFGNDRFVVPDHSVIICAPGMWTNALLYSGEPLDRFFVARHSTPMLFALEQQTASEE